MTPTADELFSRVARETAVLAEQLAAQKSLAWVNERDHLQPSCAPAARSVAASSPEQVNVSTSLGLTSHLWPRLGRIDLSFVSGAAPPVVAELKSGAGRDALAACAWDAVKLAFLLRLGHVSAAYLLAATPKSGWELAHRGTEFFSPRTFQTLALREPYLDQWRRWERDGYAAGTRVPASFATREVCREPFLVNATPWEIGVAAIHAEGEDWLEWEPTLPRQQETSTRRPRYVGPSFASTSKPMDDAR